jgi:hypothetical protein
MLPVLMGDDYGYTKVQAPSFPWHSVLTSR